MSCILLLAFGKTRGTFFMLGLLSFEVVVVVVVVVVVYPNRDVGLIEC